MSTHNKARSENRGDYWTNRAEQAPSPVPGSPLWAPEATVRQREDEIIRQALGILRQRLQVPGVTMNHSSVAKDFLRLNFAQEPSELFALVLLNTAHDFIDCKVLYRGTIDQSCVHRRDVVRCCLEHNAAAVILVHNHPSGHTEPSDADLVLTPALMDTLTPLDVRVLDHMIVGGSRSKDQEDLTPCEVYSFAEHGLI